MFLFAFWSLCFVLFAFLFLWFLTFLSFSIWWAGTGRCFWFRNIAWWQAKELEDDDELWYFCFQDFLVLDLLLPWIPLESFVSLGTPAVWAESQHPEKEACWTGDLNFSCVVYESWLFRLFSPVFSSDCLSRFPGVTDVACLSGVRVSTFSPPLFILLSYYSYDLLWKCFHFLHSTSQTFLCMGWILDHYCFQLYHRLLPVQRRLKRSELDRVWILYIRLGPNVKLSEDFMK